ncbi:hypothetical protein [Paenarthrobacter nitroguajacolicus]|uniref:hypothetical protein n=1 Tax=Paenarthrobacter nitroguajacolicus TaxID=211146 RepID=UPI0040549E0D
MESCANARNFSDCLYEALGRSAGYLLQRASKGSWLLGGGQADPATSGFVTLPAMDDYVVLFGLWDGANSRLVVNSTISANSGTIVGKSTDYAGFTKLRPQTGGMSER